VSGGPDLLSILAADTNTAVAAVAVKAASYRADALAMRDARPHPTPEHWSCMVVAYEIVSRELRDAAQELKAGAR